MEGPPKPAPTEAAERAAESPKEQLIALARELHESQERFPFPGRDSTEEAKMRATDAEYPGYTTPVGQLVARFQAEGMKVALGKHPESGNVYLLPGGSNDIENDGISPRQVVASGLDPRLEDLIRLSKS